MSESTESQINKLIFNYKRGKIFFPNNFSKTGSSAAIRQALNRLTQKEVLLRLAHGIYLYPKKHKTLGTLYPSIEEIATAIAKRDKARIIPTGIQALNQLGLSTQVPLNAVYLTDGVARSIQVGSTNIKFKKATPKALSMKSKINILVTQALKELGKNNIDQIVYSKIQEILKGVKPEHIKHDAKLAPYWIGEIIQQAKNTEHK